MRWEARPGDWKGKRREGGKYRKDGRSKEHGLEEGKRRRERLRKMRR